MYCARKPARIQSRVMKSGTGHRQKPGLTPNQASGVSMAASIFSSFSDNIGRLRQWAGVASTPGHQGLVMKHDY